MILRYDRDSAGLGFTMRSAVIATFLFIVLALFSAPVQTFLRRWFQKRRTRILLVPAALTAAFALALGNAAGPGFIAVIAAYVFGPTLVVMSGGRGERGARAADFVAILLLWLPLEFYAGKNLLPREAWGVANIMAHGVAVTLGLFLFLIFRGLKDIKYNLPQRWLDLAYPAAGFVIAAPVLAAVAWGTGFMGPFRMPEQFAPAAFAALFVKTLLGVGLPEELLFRGLIQNWLTQRFGQANAVVFAAAAIFGVAHLNNAPAPNWGYMVLATVAGFIYGKVFQRSQTILASASLHAAVNAVRHVFFL